MARKLGLKTKYRWFDHKYNEDFLDVWSNEVAWFIGLILSDWYISNPILGKFVRLKMCDRDVIDKVKIITNYHNGVGVHKPKNIKYKTSYSVEFCGNKFWNFFTNMGLDYRKSYIAKFPTIPNEYKFDVIRGVFDGDGSVSIGKKGYPFARICGTIDVVESIASKIGLHKTTHQNTDHNYIIQYTGERAVKFLDYLYLNSIELTRMNRKYYKYLDTLKWKEKRYR